MKSLLNGKKILGSWVWWLGSNIIGQAVCYEGEEFSAARSRCKNSLEMINRDNLPYFYHSTPKYYPLGK